MESELVRTFAFHGGLVLFKTILMSPLTGFHRIKNSVSKVLDSVLNTAIKSRKIYFVLFFDRLMRILRIYLWEPNPM